MLDPGIVMSGDGEIIILVVRVELDDDTCCRQRKLFECILFRLHMVPFYYNKGVFTIAYVHWKCLIQSYLCQVMANSPQFLMYAQNLLKTFAVDKENYVECILYLD